MNLLNSKILGFAEFQALDAKIILAESLFQKDVPQKVKKEVSTQDQINEFSKLWPNLKSALTVLYNV